MGFIPLFIMLGGVSFLFFFTVKTSLKAKLTRQEELRNELDLLSPAFVSEVGENMDPESLMNQLKSSSIEKRTVERALPIIRELKVNRMQYNELLRKAPYNWVAKLAGYRAI